jgi:hypothetical protein
LPSLQLASVMTWPEVTTLSRNLSRTQTRHQENCKVLTQRGQVHVFGQTFLGKMCFLAEKWTSPRTLSSPGLGMKFSANWRDCVSLVSPYIENRLVRVARPWQMGINTVSWIF